MRWPRPALLPLLGATVSTSLLWLAFRGLETAQLKALVSSYGPVLGLILLPSLVAASLDTLAWRTLLRRAGHAAGFVPLLSSRLTAEAVLLTLPSGSLVADGLMPRLLRERCGIPTCAGTASLVGRKVAQGVSHLTFLALGTVALVVTGGAGKRMPAGSALWALAAVAVALAAGSWLGLRLLAGERPLQRLLDRIARALPRLGFWLLRRDAWLRSLDGHLTRTLHGKTLALAVALLLGAWLVEAFESFLILRFLGANLGYVQVMPSEALLSLLRCLVFFIPAGLGVQDLGYVAAFDALGVPDAAATGAAFALLKRGRELFWALVGYSLLLLPTAAVEAAS